MEASLINHASSDMMAIVYDKTRRANVTEHVEI